MSVDFPPFNFTDQEGRLAGFHVDLVREVCAQLKVESKCQVQALPFDELEAALEMGEGEAVISGLAVTAELRKSFTFRAPIFCCRPGWLSTRRRNLPAPAPTQCPTRKWAW